MRENLIFKSDDEIETLKELGLFKKENFNTWEIDGERFIIHHAVANGYYLVKLKNS